MARPFSETFLGRLRAQVGSRLLQVPSFRIVVEDPAGRVLLQLRSDFRKWGLPGGHPEEEESLEDCIHRELKEETGLFVSAFEAFGFSSDPVVEVLQYPNGHVIHSYALLVRALEWGGSLDKSNDESLDLKFFALDAIPEMIPPERRAVEMFQEWKRTGKFAIG